MVKGAGAIERFAPLTRRSYQKFVRARRISAARLPHCGPGLANGMGVKVAPPDLPGTEDAASFPSPGGIGRRACRIDPAVSKTKAPIRPPGADQALSRRLTSSM